MRRTVGTSSRLELRTLDPDEESLLPTVAGNAPGALLSNSSGGGGGGTTSPQGGEGHESFMEPEDTKVFLRIHKFEFQWDLSMHLSLCIASLLPFIFSGNIVLSIFPICCWIFYNVLFMLGARRADQLFPGFDRLKRSFVSSIEEFLAPRLLPVLSLSFLSVVIGLILTSQQLGGPPLCFRSCRTCLRSWRYAIPIANETAPVLASHNNNYCGYENGKELLAYYTISQSAILIFLAVLVGLLTCLAWRVAHEELEQQQAAEEWLKMENADAFLVRERMMHQLGRPGSSVRPETNCAWLLFGFVAAVSFTAIGYKKWIEVPTTMSSVIIISVNVTIIFVSVFLLHVGFYGRLIALYKRNLSRVKYLSHCLGATDIRSWWHLRNFVLGEDLSLDYDIGGLGVSATFFIVLSSFVVALIQIFKEGLDAILSPPGSYCAYASVYLTVCLIRIFGLATKTFQEQQSHIPGLITVMQEVAQHERKEIEGLTDGYCVGGGVGAESHHDLHLTASRDEIEDMINQIIRFDPYPCILGIPVKPALFATSKVYIFICFTVVGTKILFDLVYGLLTPQWSIGGPGGLPPPGA